MKKIMYFSAEWCQPCKSYKPILQQVTSELGINVEYIDIDSSATLVESYGIRSVPTTLLMVDNTIIFKHSGVLTRDQLRNNLM